MEGRFHVCDFLQACSWVIFTSTVVLEVSWGSAHRTFITLVDNMFSMKWRDDHRAGFTPDSTGLITLSCSPVNHQVCLQFGRNESQHVHVGSKVEDSWMNVWCVSVLQEVQWRIIRRGWWSSGCTSRYSTWCGTTLSVSSGSASSSWPASKWR